jgi:lipopolysaccharide assembly outer membrane protein LptD (OstA)
MPSISLNFPQTSLWFGPKHPKGSRGLWERALGSVLFSPNISATRATTESKVRSQGTLAASSNASFGQQRNIGFVSFSPGVGVQWNYFKQLYDRISPTFASKAPPHQPDRDEVSMNFGLSNVGTKLYGTFQPHIGPLVAIRHTINPTVSYSYTPKLSERQRSSQFVSYALRNSVDLKLKKNGQEIKQSGVLSWDLTGNYNPDLPRHRAWSNISSSTRVTLGGLISFNLNNTWSTRDHQIISTSFSTGFNLRGVFAYPATWSEPTRERIAAAVGDKEVLKTKQGEQPGQAAMGAKTGNWSFRVNYNFTETGLAALRRTNSNLDFSGNLQLSRGWSVSYSGYYDIEAHTFSNQVYTLERDLHCWHAGFTHRRFGNDRSYYFQIAIKAHPEIMYERGTRGLQSFFNGGSLPGGY